MNMDRYLKLLGLNVRDVITGFEGVVTSISFDLYGCVQSLVTCPVKAAKDGETKFESFWFDEKRLIAIDTTPVMDVPSFGGSVPGGQTLPLPSSNPAR